MLPRYTNGCLFKTGFSFRQHLKKAEQTTPKVTPPIPAAPAVKPPAAPKLDWKDKAFGYLTPVLQTAGNVGLSMIGKPTVNFEHINQWNQAKGDIRAKLMGPNPKFQPNTPEGAFVSSLTDRLQRRVGSAVMTGNDQTGYLTPARMAGFLQDELNRPELYQGARNQLGGINKFMVDTFGSPANKIHANTAANIEQFTHALREDFTKKFPGRDWDTYSLTPDDFTQWAQSLSDENSPTYQVLRGMARNQISGGVAPFVDQYGVPIAIGAGTLVGVPLLASMMGGGDDDEDEDEDEDFTPRRRPRPRQEMNYF